MCRKCAVGGSIFLSLVCDMALADKPPVSVDGLMENKLESQAKIETDISGNNGRHEGEFLSPQIDCLAHIPEDPKFPLLIPRRKQGVNGNNRVAFESFSILRARLLSVHNKLGIKSVVITSAEAGDGKTLVAA